MFIVRYSCEVYSFYILLCIYYCYTGRLGSLAVFQAEFCDPIRAGGFAGANVLKVYMYCTYATSILYIILQLYTRCIHIHAYPTVYIILLSYYYNIVIVIVITVYTNRSSLRHVWLTF